MSQREVEHLVGRLVTDEEFRDRFVADPRGVLTGLAERGIALSTAEIDALVATSGEVWQRAAQEVDARLQKVSLKGGRPTPASSGAASDAASDEKSRQISSEQSRETLRGRWHKTSDDGGVER